MIRLAVPLRNSSGLFLVLNFANDTISTLLAWKNAQFAIFTMHKHGECVSKS